MVAEETTPKTSQRALLVVDILNDFLDPQGALYLGEAAREIIPMVQGIVATAREDNNLIVFIRDWHRPDDAEFAMFPPHGVADTWGSQFIPELEPQASDRVIEKRRYSAFYGTELDLTLREAGIEELHLVGVCTNICILYSAASARNRNYRVIVHDQAMAGTTRDAHEWALNEMKNTLGCERMSMQ